MAQNKQKLTIAIQSEAIAGNVDTLERLEPWECERVLGVRMPMNGVMTKEYNYRVKQMGDLAIKIYRAFLSPLDAEIIYQTRYKAMIRYALPVTNFNNHQLQWIQQK